MTITFERLSVRLCLLSAACAIALEAVLGSRVWPHLVPLTGAAFAAAVAGTLASDAASVAAVLAATYVFPAIVLVLHGGFQIAFETPWMAAVLGAIATRSWRGGWQVDEPWRTPLLLWAWVIVLAWPIVVLRELDFVPALIADYTVSSSSVGIPPPVAITWVLNVSVALLVGILLFNWLTIRFSNGLEAFRNWIVAPLLGSALATIAVGLYQMFGDVLFVNTTVFGATGRASGAMLDGNAFGMAAVLCGLLSLAMASAGRRRFIAVMLPLSLLAAWGSGSRSAFLAALLACVVGITALPFARLLPRRRNRASAAAALLLAFVAVVAVASRLTETGPLHRLRQSISVLGGVRPFAIDLWYRNGYGLAASRMIADHPWFGVGVGSFHLLVPDYGRDGRRPLAPDNAQNWYRHQFAEFGIVGSLGWIGWVVLFGWCVAFGRAAPSARVTSHALRGALLIFGGLSLVGMPGQDVALAMTFWVIAFWYSKIATCHWRRLPTIGAPWFPHWAVIAVVVAAATIGTAAAARHSLRVPVRAIRAGWPYEYGFYQPESAPGGGAQRWTRKNAAIVIAAPSARMKVTVSVNHGDVVTHPVHARVLVDGRVVIDEELHSSGPLTVVVDVAPWTRVLLETSVDRVFRPSDRGLEDSRELGLLVRWEFAGTPSAELSGWRSRVGRRDDARCTIAESPT